MPHPFDFLSENVDPPCNILSCETGVMSYKTSTMLVTVPFIERRDVELLRLWVKRERELPMPPFHLPNRIGIRNECPCPGYDALPHTTAPVMP